MGQKDLAAKQFERSPEVFADIINALVFEGEEVILPKDLQPAPTESLYPAITLVLYWGDTAWHSSPDLHRFFRGKKIHRAARKYIDNVCLHMYSMRCLPQEIRQRFRSDMRIVVDYLAEGEKYMPTDQEIVDPAATMRMLNALTGEFIFLDNIKILQEQQEKGGKITMGYAMSMLVERGREQGVQEGREQGIQEGIQEGRKEEKMRCAEAFVKETVLQKQPKEYITGILQTCFQLKEEEADNLYRKCTEIRLFIG